MTPKSARIRRGSLATFQSVVYSLESMLPQETGILALPRVHYSSSLPSFFTGSFLVWLGENLRKQIRPGQMHPVRDQAVGEGKRAEVCFLLGS